MERLRQLNTCKVCDNLSYDIDRGIVCRVTNDIAAFENKCTNYSKSMEILTMDSIKNYKKNKTKKILGSFLKKHLLPAFVVIFLIACGYLMILWPELFKTTQLDSPSGTIKQFINTFWGVPTGIILLMTGIYFLVIYVKRRKSYLL